jgi:hypothetical protein
MDSQEAVFRSFFPHDQHMCRGKDPVNGEPCPGVFRTRFEQLSFRGGMFFVFFTRTTLRTQKRITVGHSLRIGTLSLHLVAVCMKTPGHYYGYGRVRNKDSTSYWVKYDDLARLHVAGGKVTRVDGDAPWEHQRRDFPRLAVYVPSVVDTADTPIDLRKYHQFNKT